MSEKRNKFYPQKPVGQVSDQLGEREFFDEEADISKKTPRHLIWPYLVVTFIFFFLATRLFQLQVKEGFANLALAEGNRIKEIPIAGARGQVIDSKGQVLATNSASYDLITRITKVKDLEKVDPTIFEITGLSKDAISELVKKHSTISGYTILKENLPRDEALLMKSRLPVYGEFDITPTFIREYTDPSLSHILGYVGKVNDDEQKNKPIAAINGSSGKAGIEKVYDDYLQGVPGTHKAEVNVSNQLVRFLSSDDPQIGRSVKLTINDDLQKFAFEKLKAKTDELKTQGALVAMNPQNGSILALVSLPLYDNKKLSTGISQKELDDIFNNPSKPFLNRVISGVYPSGSSIKPFIATAALEEGVVNEDTSFETPPFIEVGQWKFPDWKDHGVTDIKRAIAESNNIFFYSIGGGWGPVKKGLGPDRIKKGLEKFGFGALSGIDLPSEQKGFLPTPEWKKRTTGESWYIGNTYNMSIGQGDLLVTPLQIAGATSVVANGGKQFRPYLVSEILDADKKVDAANVGEKLIAKDTMSGNNLRIVRDGMRQTVTSGSARSVFGENFPTQVSAKTGTAQFGTEDKTHGWFTSFAPSDNPQIVVTVIIEAGGEGYESAAPVAKDVLEWWANNK